MDNILVIGHTGFIGKSIYDKLRKTKEYDSVCGVSTKEIDLINPKSVDDLDLYIKTKTTIIYCSFIKRNKGDNIDNCKENIDMVINLIKKIENNQNISNFIYLSSAAIYGEDIENKNINEESSIVTNTYYALAKFTTENLFKLALSHSHINLLIIRAPTVYGPGDITNGYEPYGFFNKIKNNDEIELWGDGDELRSFLFIDDLVKIISLLIKKNINDVVNISSIKSYSFLEVISKITKFLDVDLKVKNKPRTKEKVDHVFNNKKLISMINDFEFTDMDKSIELINMFEDK